MEDIIKHTALVCMCVPPDSFVEILTPKDDGNRRGLWEVLR